MDRSDWKIQTPADAISATRAALTAIDSPHSNVSLDVDLLDYVDDGVWLVVPGRSAPDDVDVSAIVDVHSGEVSIGGYRRASIDVELDSSD